MEVDNQQDVAQLETWITETKGKIRSAEIATMSEIGGLITDELIQRLNIPWPPASVEDEDPHRRTGQLSAGTKWSTDEFDFGVVTNVVSSREGGDPKIPEYLNSGTSIMAPRRYMDRTQEEWETKFPETFEELFWGYYA